MVLILPVADISPAVVKLPPLTLPVTLTNPPVKLAVFTMVVNIPLLAVALPVTSTDPTTVSPCSTFKPSSMVTKLESSDLMLLVTICGDVMLPEAKTDTTLIALVQTLTPSVPNVSTSVEL